MEEPVKSSSLRYVCLDGHANSFALSKDNNFIAVAGRSLLKVYSIETDTFSEVHNMRQQSSNSKSSSSNLTYSSNAIDWCKIDANILATAATNGCISIWDLNKFGRQKQLNVYHDHERTTHAVSFHHQDANSLLSASQDSTIKLFDLRERSSCVSTFSSTESVRDVKFNPFNCNSFASVSENGCVHLWDCRRPEKFVQQFTAHSGPIYCLDWHPTQQWLATGSRDKLIKVWNMTNVKPSLEYTIYTIAVVGRVKWRPDRKYHIASCSLVVDYSVYIWDVRRPYIPYASFNEHTNVTTDIAFKGVPDVLISTSKDSTIYKHATKDAQHPALSANPQSATVNPRGEILFVCKAKVKNPPTMTTSTSSLKLPAILKKNQDVVDAGSNVEQFHLAKSSLHFFTDNPDTGGPLNEAALTKILHKEYSFFTGCAKEYKLKPDNQNDFLEMLEHNSLVAKKYGRPNVSMLWNLVKIIYKSMPPKRQAVSHNLITQTSNQSSSGQSVITRGGSFGTAGLSILNGSNGPQTNPVGSGENISTTDEILNDSNEIITVPKIPIPDLEVEIYDENMTPNAIDCKNLRNGFLYTGPHDSFVKDFPICSSSLINHELMHQHYRNHRNEMEREMIETSPPPDAPSFLSVTMQDDSFIQHWKPYQVLADCLVLQSEVGDVQTPTCILLCLGKDREDLPIDKVMQENFLQSYIDMLHRHQMWNEATEIMKMSWMPIVSEMNQQSTVIHTSCGECGRAMQSWFCRHCKSADPSKCVVCNEIVKGAFTFCSFCCHGGHLHHMVEWFSQNPRCPKCNHICEYD